MLRGMLYETSKKLFIINLNNKNRCQFIIT